MLLQCLHYHTVWAKLLALKSQQTSQSDLPSVLHDLNVSNWYIPAETTGPGREKEAEFGPLERPSRPPGPARQKAEARAIAPLINAAGSLNRLKLHPTPAGPRTNKERDEQTVNGHRGKELSASGSNHRARQKLTYHPSQSLESLSGCRSKLSGCRSKHGGPSNTPCLN